MSAFPPWRPRSASAGLARVLPIAVAALLIVPAGVAGKSFDAWGTAVPDGERLHFGRDGNIFVSTR